jgi:hypothetical protein
MKSSDGSSTRDQYRAQKPEKRASWQPFTLMGWFLSFPRNPRKSSPQRWLSVTKGCFTASYAPEYNYLWANHHPEQEGQPEHSRKFQFAGIQESRSRK